MPACAKKKKKMNKPSSCTFQGHPRMRVFVCLFFFSFFSFLFFFFFFFLFFFLRVASRCSICEGFDSLSFGAFKFAELRACAR